MRTLLECEDGVRVSEVSIEEEETRSAHTLRFRVRWKGFLSYLLLKQHIVNHVFIARVSGRCHNQIICQNKQFLVMLVFAMQKRRDRCSFSLVAQPITAARKQLTMTSKLLYILANPG